MLMMSMKGLSVPHLIWYLFQTPDLGSDHISSLLSVRGVVIVVYIWYCHHCRLPLVVVGNDGLMV